MPFVHSPKGKALVLAVHSRETRNFSRETRLVSRETRLVSRETRRVSRDGGNLHLSGTVLISQQDEIPDIQQEIASTIDEGPLIEPEDFIIDVSSVLLLQILRDVARADL